MRSKDQNTRGVLNTDLLTAPFVRTLFGVSDATLRRWRKHRGMPHIVVVAPPNGLILYDEVALDWWADQQGLQTFPRALYKTFKHAREDAQRKLTCR